MSKELASLLGKRFIQRRDVKAVQFDNGDWCPDTKLKNPGKHGPVGFKMNHLLSHLEGDSTYGHYLIDDNNKARVFAFDIDLEKTGSWVRLPDWDEVDPNISNEEFEKLLVNNEGNPRELWTDRKEIDARSWYKFQMKELAHKFLSVIDKDLQLDCAAAYSGSKGVHVYGFTGEMDSAEVREAAMLVMDILGEFELSRGKNFYKHKNDSPHNGFPSFSVEVFPKQENLDGKKLGNLLRLPMGKNLKNPKDPTFFLDMTTPMAQFKPHPNPVRLLETGNPFSD